MNYSKIVCFDLEMCCWKDETETGKKTGEIIEIGLCKIDLEKGTILKRAQYYVKPEKDEISEFCTDLTKITKQIINKQGRPLAEVIKTMIKNFGGSNCVYAAWGRDDQVLFNECIEKGIQLPFDNYLNIALLDRVKNRRNSKVNMIDVMNEYDLAFEGQLHSGADDAYNLGRLCLKIL